VWNFLDEEWNDYVDEINTRMIDRFLGKAMVL
jgi:ATP-dependent DNA helicase PIF1